MGREPRLCRQQDKHQRGRNQPHEGNEAQQCKLAEAIADPPPERVRSQRSGGLGGKQRAHIGDPQPAIARGDHIEGQRHRRRRTEPLEDHEQPEGPVAAEGVEPLGEEGGEAGACPPRPLGRGRRLSGGHEERRGDQHQRRPQREDQRIGLQGRHRVERQPQRAGHGDGQQAPAEEAPGQHPAAAPGRDRAADDVVVGHADHTADEGIDGPEREEPQCQRHRRPVELRPVGAPPQQHRDGSRGRRPSEGAEDIEGHPPGAAFRQPAHRQLGQHPAQAQDGAGIAHRQGAAGQQVHEARHHRRAVHRRRSALKRHSRPGDAPEAVPGEARIRFRHLPPPPVPAGCRDRIARARKARCRR